MPFDQPKHKAGIKYLALGFVVLVDYSSLRHSQSETVVMTLIDNALDNIIDGLLLEPNFGDGITNALPKLVLHEPVFLVLAEDARPSSA